MHNVIHDYVTTRRHDYEECETDEYITTLIHYYMDTCIRDYKIDEVNRGPEKRPAMTDRNR